MVKRILSDIIGSMVKYFILFKRKKISTNYMQNIHQKIPFYFKYISGIRGGKSGRARSPRAP